MYIHIASMNPSEEAELDHILTGADYTERDEATEQLGTVRSPMNDVRGTEGMAYHEGSGGELQVGEGSCQGPSLSLTSQLLRIRTCNNSYSVISFWQINALAQNEN